MKNVTKLINLSALLLFIIGAAVYYTWPAFEDESARPPLLSIGGTNFEGLLKNPKGFFEFTDEEISAAGECDDNTVEIAKGTHFYHVNEKTSLKDLIEMINPVKDNNMLFAFYSPGEETDELAKGFHVFPNGGRDNFTIRSENLDNFKILRHRGFVVHATRDTKFCNASDLVKTEKQASERLNLLKNKEKGWISIPSLGDVAAMEAAWESDKDRISKIWVQDGENHFKETNLDDPQLSVGYYMIWLYLDEKESVS